MSKTWIIDGYNLIYAWSLCNEKVNVLDACDVLIRELNELPYRNDTEKVIIVFDGNSNTCQQIRPHNNSRLVVIYTSKDLPADAWIDRFAQNTSKKERRNYIVVTRDLPLANTLEQNGTLTISPNNFKKEVYSRYHLRHTNKKIDKTTLEDIWPEQ